MIIHSLHKRNVICACGCLEELSVGDTVNKMNGKYYKLYCAKIYRLNVECKRWIKENFLGK